jgi:hypothetical protein
MHGLTCPLTITGCASSRCLPRDAPEDNGGELEQFGELLVPLALGLPPVVRLALQGNHSVSHTPRKLRTEAGHRGACAHFWQEGNMQARGRLRCSQKSLLPIRTFSLVASHLWQLTCELL